ncbi:MAG: hypothetical protein PHQ64_02575 [Bacilli bacterium]|nr:hypothetical protein [Bacilli bacterium]
MINGTVGLKTNEKVICVFFILLILSFIVLPPILREKTKREKALAIEKAKEAMENSGSGIFDDLTGTVGLSCTLYNENGEKRIDFSYSSSDKLVGYDVTEVENFDENTVSTNEEFKKKAALCTETDTLFATITGYRRDCRQRTNRFITTTSYTLSLFGEKTVKQSDGTEIKVTSEFKNTDKKATVKEKLEGQGYNCQ